MKNRTIIKVTSNEAENTHGILITISNVLLFVFKTLIKNHPF